MLLLLVGQFSIFEEFKLRKLPYILESSLTTLLGRVQHSVITIQYRITPIFDTTF